MRAICAGIINTHTGEIIQTVRIPREKNDLRATLRDELDPTHGQGVFQLFSFKTTPPPNSELVRLEKVLDANGVSLAQRGALKELELTFYLACHNNRLTQAEAELALVQETRNETLALFSHHPQKTEVVEAAFEGQIADCHDAIDTIKAAMARVRTSLATITT